MNKQDTEFEELFSRLIKAESAGRHRGKDGQLLSSPVGALGITQVMPKTGRDPGYGVKPVQNDSEEEYVRFGRDYLQAMIKEFGGDKEKALAAYNAGPGHVKNAVIRASREGGDWKKHLPKPQETLPYIDKILGRDGKKKSELTHERAMQEVEGYTQFAQVRKDIDHTTLNQDPAWLDASEMMYQMWEGKGWEGDDDGLAEWGLKFMADFNYNSVQMVRFANRVNDSLYQEDKEAFLYMMDTFDNVQMSWAGAGRAASALARDPFTYIGIGSLGIGSGAKIAAGAGAKAGVRQLLKQGLGRTGVIAGIEGGIYTGTENSIRQGIEVNAGRKESKDYLEMAGKTALGAGVGVVAGTTLDAAATGVVQWFRGRSGKVAGINVGDQTAKEIPKTDAPPPKENLPSTEVLSSHPPGTWEKPRGRNPIDDQLVGPGGVDATDLRAAGFNLPEIGTGLRTTPRTLAEVKDFAAGLARQLRNMEAREVETVVEALRNTKATFEEFGSIAASVQITANRLKVEHAAAIKKLLDNPNSPDFVKLKAEVDELERLLTPIELADDAFGSMSGSMLVQRQMGLTDLRRFTPEEIMKQNPGMSREDAQRMYVDGVLTASEKAGRRSEVQAARRAYDQKIDEAMKQGEVTKAIEHMAQREMEAGALIDQIVGLEALASPKIGRATTMEKLNEAAISNIFSTTTLAINLVPSAIKMLSVPTVRAIVSNPLEAATRAELAASYTAMSKSIRGAWQAARAAFRYEQALLTRDSGRLLEGELAIGGTKEIKGDGLFARTRRAIPGTIRIFPRLLNTTDEFLSHLAYNGYVGGKAASLAHMEGVAKGLTGKALKDHVNQSVTSALKHAYKDHALEDVVKPLVNKGVNLGHRGDALTQYVAREYAKSKNALRHGADKEGLDYVRDVLYKRHFSGDNAASSVARSYEDMVNKHPSFKFVLGQLFFRTPIRVFEEGIRLTPGVQFLAPKFLGDLAGKNGQARQARAQGEALMSLAFTGAAFQMYAEGRAGGDGAYNNWRQEKVRGDSDLADQYTIKMKDGSTWSYRNFDPIATPMKIMLNGFERLDKLTVRQAQGEFVDSSKWEAAMAYVWTGVTAITSAIQDANLVEGLNGTVRLGQNLADPEERSDALIKFMGEKLHYLVPNTFHKAAKTVDPRVKDPTGFWQQIEHRLHIRFNDEVKTAFAYDALGNTRTITDTGALWNLFSTASIEQREKGRSPEENFVLEQLDRLAHVTGLVVAPAYQHRMTGDLDLRTKLTSDGSKTLYDRWNELYRDLNPAKVLYPILSAELPDGTFEHKGLRVQQVQSIMGELRNAAFMQLMAEEKDNLMREYVNREVRKVQSQGGLWDHGRRSGTPQLPW